MSLAMADAAADRAAYLARLQDAGLAAPWSQPGPLIPVKPSATQARHWRWRDVAALLRESAGFVVPGHGADRRILRLANPGVPDRIATHSISIAIQYLLPGEVAPAHRHTPGAIRFMIEGEGAYTTVSGRKCVMAPGDVVVTPSWSWHDHGNEGDAPVVWMDILDWPMVRFMENLAVEPFAETRQDVGAPESGPDIFHPWRDIHAALLRQAAAATDPAADIVAEYLDPAGRTLLPALGCALRLIPPGTATSPRRETGSALCHVVAGSGTTVIDGTCFAWGARDFIAIPPHARVSHEAVGPEPAILFVVRDAPLLEFLGLYRCTPA